MKTLSQSEIQKAYRRWYLKHKTTFKDESLQPFLSENIEPRTAAPLGALRTARSGLLLSSGNLADSLGISRAAYSKLEESEEFGTISLNSLSAAAAAMDCESVYCIRPKNKKLFSEIIWGKLLKKAIQHPWLSGCDPRKKSAALESIATQLMSDGEFRKVSGWSRKKL